jgi:hypothetical protein
MMQRALVRAADIHAGPAADRLQPLENLDILGGIAAALAFGLLVEKIVWHGADYRAEVLRCKQDKVENKRTNTTSCASVEELLKRAAAGEIERPRQTLSVRRWRIESHAMP